MEDAGWRLRGRPRGGGPAVRRLHAARTEEDEDRGRRFRPPVQVRPALLDLLGLQIRTGTGLR